MSRNLIVLSTLLAALAGCTERPERGTHDDALPVDDALIQTTEDAALTPPDEAAPPVVDGGQGDVPGPAASHADLGASQRDLKQESPDAPLPLADTSPPPADAGVAIDSAPPASDVQIPAREILLFDGAHRQFTVKDNGFHKMIKPGDALPLANWLSPVDYHNGQLQIRYVVEGPANQAPGKLQTCIWTMGDEDGDGRNYFPESCSSQVVHDGPGTYFNARLVPADWWRLDNVPLDFAHPERFLIRVVLRGASGCNVTTYNVKDGCWDQWPLYEQMKFRVTLVMVPAGATFSGWQNYQ